MMRKNKIIIGIKKVIKVMRDTIVAVNKNLFLVFIYQIKFKEPETSSNRQFKAMKLFNVRYNSLYSIFLIIWCHF